MTRVPSVPTPRFECALRASTHGTRLARSAARIAPLVCALILCASGPAFAEPHGGTRGHAPDPSFLEQYAATLGFSAGRPASVTVVPDGSEVLFLRSGPRERARDLFALAVGKGEERVLATAAGLTGGGDETLSAEERARRERLRLTAGGITSFAVSNDGAHVLVPLSGRLFVVERTTGASRELTPDAAYALDARWSPDDRAIACVRDGDVHVVDLESGVDRRITAGASDTVTYGLPEFVAQEEMSRFEGYWWSPDASELLIQRTDTADVETFYIMDPADPAKAPQTWPYPRPGKSNARVALAIHDLDAKREPLDVLWDRERWPYLNKVVWTEGAPLTIQVQDRVQSEVALLTVDRATGATRVVHTERDDAWIDLDQSVPRWLADGSAFLWSTQRGGRWQLELRGADGALRRALTPLDLEYRRLEHVDEDAGVAWIVASADPTGREVFRVSLGGDSIEAVSRTPEPGYHDVGFADDGGIHVVTSSLPDGSWRGTVHAADGKKLAAIESLAEEPGFHLNVERTRTSDDPDAFHAVLIRPRGFTSKRRYPVIVHVYGGPTSVMVRSTGTRYRLDQWIADHGFIVVSIDGRGTPGRGRAWHRAMRGNFIDVPLADQVDGLAALGKRFPELDLDRVGVYGWSFGGYFSAMGVLQRPDVFHAGWAGAPVADWLDYDTHYTERYLGLPQECEACYTESSVLTFADRLERPLRIVHGTADDNVYFTHAVKMSDALMRAGKPHEFVPIAGATHRVRDPEVQRRMYDGLVRFFRDHLGRPVPRDAERKGKGGSP